MDKFTKSDKKTTTTNKNRVTDACPFLQRTLLSDGGSNTYPEIACVNKASSSQTNTELKKRFYFIRYPGHTHSTAVVGLGVGVPKPHGLKAKHENFLKQRLGWRVLGTGFVE